MRGRFMDEILQEEMRATIRALKENPDAPNSRQPVFLFGRKVAWLSPVARADLMQMELLSLLRSWHRRSSAGGPSLAPSAVVGAERWLTEQVLEVPDHVLFWVRDLEGALIGHLGLAGLDAGQKQAEVGYILRGVPDALPGVMYGATQALIGWAFQAFPIRQVVLRVFPSNRPALCLAERCGFAGALAASAARAKNSSESANVMTLTLTRVDWMEAHRITRAAA
jgi:RimJ/RimL family protein N-acetyltransferase